MNFFISKNSTKPTLRYELNDKILAKYDITSEMLDNCAVTFSMVDENGVYKIANKAGTLMINTLQDEFTFFDNNKYTLAYNFTLSDTNKAGIYEGEFKVDFLGDAGCGKFTFPVTEMINIYIQDSTTKTSVV